MSSRSGIYAIYNTIENKYYVGSSVNIQRRWNSHLRELKKEKHFNYTDVSVSCIAERFQISISYCYAVCKRKSWQTI